MVFDGALNAMGNGVRALITSLADFQIPFTARICFDSTKNMEEYKACIYVLYPKIFPPFFFKTFS